MRLHDVGANCQCSCLFVVVCFGGCRVGCLGEMRLYRVPVSSLWHLELALLSFSLCFRELRDTYVTLILAVALRRSGSGVNFSTVM
jgi:hypothetical protein